MSEKKVAGSILVEMAFCLPIFLFLVLGGLDLIWDATMNADINYLAGQAAICLDKQGCDPVGYVMSSAHGFHLDSSRLRVDVDPNKNVTVTYVANGLVGFLSPVVLSVTAKVP